MQTPRIDPEFKDLIPPLSAQEYAQLEQNLLAQGCRDPIVLWRGTIIDGHNRHRICTTHGIEYATTKLRFPSRQAVVLWILDNQLGRRNITDATRIELAALKLRHMGTQAHKSPPRNALAREAQLSEQTIQRYMHIKTQGSPELLQQVMSGQLKIGTAYKQIQVTTTTREPLPFTPATPEEQSLHTAGGILGNVRQLMGLHDFLIQYLPCRGGMGEDVAAWVDRQCRRVEGVMAA